MMIGPCLSDDSVSCLADPHSVNAILLFIKLIICTFLQPEINYTVFTYLRSTRFSILCSYHYSCVHFILKAYM